MPAPQRGEFAQIPPSGARVKQSSLLLSSLHGDAVEGLAALQEVVEVEDHGQPPGVDDEVDDAADQGRDKEAYKIIMLGRVAPVADSNVECEQGDKDAASHLSDDGPDHEGKSQHAVVLGKESGPGQLFVVGTASGLFSDSCKTYGWQMTE